MKHHRILLAITLLCAVALQASSQVSTDNEDGVYRMTGQNHGRDFVSGQVLVKFKDESAVEARRNEQGRFRSAGLRNVDQLLTAFGATDMEKLFPLEEAKPLAQLRSRLTPSGRSIVKERNLDKVYWIKTQMQSSDSLLQLVSRLNALPEVEYAEPNYRVYVTADMAASKGVKSPSKTKLRPVPSSCETAATVICPDPVTYSLYMRVKAPRYVYRKPSLSLVLVSPLQSSDVASRLRLHG